MKAKNIVLIIIMGLVLINTMGGCIFDDYQLLSCILVNMSMLLSAGVLYYLLASEDITGGFKVSLTAVFSITGMIRTICLFLMEAELKNNITLIVVALIFLLEVIGLILASYLSKI